MSAAIIHWDGLGPVPTPARQRCLSIGNFDGVHLGHAELMRLLARQAELLDAQPWAVTFEPHPLTLLRPEYAQPQLTPLAERCHWLAAAGAVGVLVLDTTLPLLQMSATEFFHQVLVEGLGVLGLVEGENFAFGKNRQGTISVLRQLCQEARLPLEIVPPVHVEGMGVSSSRVRQALRQGDVAAAASLLGRPYALVGQVMPGQRRGMALGFPTANLTEIETLIPAEGVYAAEAVVGGERWPAAINIGANPTFDESERKVEAHLIGFSGDLYGRTVRLELRRWLRATRRFASPADLSSQLHQDVALAASLEGVAP